MTGAKPVRTLLGLLVAATLSLAPRPVAQESSRDLQGLVDRYFGTADDPEARQLLERILAHDEATPERLLELVRTPAIALSPGINRIRIPHDGQLWDAELHLPEGHGHDQPALPVLLDIARGTMVTLADFSGVIWITLPQYTPEQFSETGRDGFLKAVRTAAFLANGDDLWLGGHSWAGHASYGTAMHRPDVLRGIVTSGGGPRRNWFRLKANLEGLRVLSFVGGREDPELIWNLQELPRDSVGRDLDYRLWLDPEVGHDPRVKGYDEAPVHVVDAPDQDPRRSGTLLADGPFVENPWIRILAVDDSAVEIPDRIPVSARLDADGQRRATIRAMEKKVARIRWSLEVDDDTLTLELAPKGVQRIAVFLHHDDLDGLSQVEIRRGSKTVHRGPAEIDRGVLLQEARRTGERRNPTVLRVELET